MSESTSNVNIKIEFDDQNHIIVITQRSGAISRMTSKNAIIK